MTGKRRLAVLLGVLVSLIMLWAAFSGLNPAEVIASLRSANIPLLLVAVVLFFVSLVVITWRWQFLLRAVKPVPFGDLCQLVTIGYMGNNIYPFRSGELLRILLLRRGYDIPMARSATTIVVERIFDGLVMLSFIIVPLAFLTLPNSTPEVQTAANVAAPIFIGALATFLFLAAQPNLLRRLTQFVVKLLPVRLRQLVTDLAEEVISGLEGLRNVRDLSGTVFASFLTWIVQTWVYWVVALAFGMDIPYLAMFPVVGIVNLAGLLPASPGQVGVFEFFASRMLIGFGIPETQATAYALLVHIVIWLPPTVLGFYFLVRRGLGWSAVVQASQMSETAETAQ